MKGLSSASSRLTALPARVNHSAQSAIRQASAAACDQARAAAPVRTGNLKSSISSKLEPGRATVSVRAPYAGIVEGRAPYLAPAARRADYVNKAAKALKEALK